jgi:hypothetical protein
MSRRERQHVESGASSLGRIAWQGGLQRDRRPAIFCAHVPSARFIEEELRRS